MLLVISALKYCLQGERRENTALKETKVHTFTGYTLFSYTDCKGKICNNNNNNLHLLKKNFLTGVDRALQIMNNIGN